MGKITTTAGKYQLEGDAAGVVAGAISVAHVGYIGGSAIYDSGPNYKDRLYIDIESKR